MKKTKRKRIRAPPNAAGFRSRVSRSEYCPSVAMDHEAHLGLVQNIRVIEFMHAAMVTFEFDGRQAQICV